jgi:hypothetical protein
MSARTRPVCRASFKMNGAALNVAVNQNRGFTLNRVQGAALIAAVVAAVVRAISLGVPVTVAEWVAGVGLVPVC